MYNLYDYSLQEANYRQLECDGCLFVEYQCIPGKALVHDLWSHHENIAFVTAGKKIWISPDGEYPATTGEAIYSKKGACMVRNFYENEFCALLFFFPDDFIKETVVEYQESISIRNNNPGNDFQILKLNVDGPLKSYFDSVVAYFFQKENPSKHILKLKFKELLLQVLTSRQNPELAHYFQSLTKENKVNLKKIMMDNYFYSLGLEDYAKLCFRSLSSFKRDFMVAFRQSPGKWLNEQRLKYAKLRLLTTEENINDVAFHSGFETTSHFIRCFKKYYGLPPLQFRQQNILLPSNV